MSNLIFFTLSGKRLLSAHRRMDTVIWRLINNSTVLKTLKVLTKFHLNFFINVTHDNNFQSISFNFTHQKKITLQVHTMWAKQCLFVNEQMFVILYVGAFVLHRFIFELTSSTKYFHWIFLKNLLNIIICVSYLTKVRPSHETVIGFPVSPVSVKSKPSRLHHQTTNT